MFGFDAGRTSTVKLLTAAAPHESTAVTRTVVRPRTLAAVGDAVTAPVVSFTLTVPPPGSIVG
jgi:hypothetical protein